MRSKTIEERIIRERDDRHDSVDAKNNYLTKTVSVDMADNKDVSSIEHTMSTTSTWCTRAVTPHGIYELQSVLQEQ
jgi:hypothetical protein